MKHTEEKCLAKIAKWEKRLKESRKPELEIGKWYKKTVRDTTYLMVWNNEANTYGFFGGSYDTNWFLCRRDNLEPATHNEIEEALIKEAEKRGFKDVKNNFIDVDNGTKDHPLRFDGLFLMPCRKELCDGYGNVIFNNGKWSEITEDPIYEYRWICNGMIIDDYYAINEDNKGRVETALYITDGHKPILETKRVRK